MQETVAGADHSEGNGKGLLEEAGDRETSG